MACENSKPGTDPEIWDIDGAGDSSIQGFATDISVNVGQRIDFKIKTDASAYTIDIYRTGWYQGLGARKIASVTPSASLPQNQPNCITDVTTELYDCGNWAVSASWNVPTTAVSGVYIAHLKRSNGDASHITFIVRDDASTSDVVFQTSDPTWQAYNTYGGSDFYQGGANGRAYKVSYNRPFDTRGTAGGRDFYFGAEYAVRALPRAQRLRRLLHRRRRHRPPRQPAHEPQGLPVRRARRVLERRRSAPTSRRPATPGSTCSSSPATRSTGAPATSRRPTPRARPYRTLVSYKETWGNAKIDPTASGPARGATRASPRPPTAAARRRTRSSARRTWSTSATSR